MRALALPPLLLVLWTAAPSSARAEIIGESTTSTATRGPLVAPTPTSPRPVTTPSLRESPLLQVPPFLGGLVLNLAGTALLTAAFVGGALSLTLEGPILGTAAFIGGHVLLMPLISGTLDTWARRGTVDFDPWRRTVLAGAIVRAVGIGLIFLLAGDVMGFYMGAIALAVVPHCIEWWVAGIDAGAAARPVDAARSPVGVPVAARW